MKKTISLIAICMIAVLSLTSCMKKFSNAVVEKMATETNKSCPLQVNSLVTLTGVKVDGDYFVYNYDVNESLASLEQLAEMGEIDRDITIINLIQSEDGKGLVTILDEAGKTLRYVYKGAETGKEIVNDILPSEILNFDQAKITSVIKEKLEESVEQTNANCPIQIDEITYLTSVVMTEDSFCYLYTIDEDKITMDLLRENIETLAANLQESAFGENASMTNLINNCKLIGYTVLFQYEGSNSEDYFQLKLNHEDKTVEIVE